MQSYRQFTDLVGGKDAEGPLDWISVGISISEIAHSGDDTGNENENDEEENFENSYFNWDIADWDIQGAGEFDAPD
jgi:hypothetical protein